MAATFISHNAYGEKCRDLPCLCFEKAGGAGSLRVDALELACVPSSLRVSSGSSRSQQGRFRPRTVKYEAIPLVAFLPSIIKP